MRSKSGLPARRERSKIVAEMIKVVADLGKNLIVRCLSIDFIPQDTKVGLQSRKNISYVKIGKCR
jgi:hypothetical protein